MDSKKIYKKHILQSIKKIEQAGVPEGRHSSTYDLFFDGNLYPPVYVIEIANELAGNKKSRFRGGRESDCFNILENEGFYIFEKNTISRLKKLNYGDVQCFYNAIDKIIFSIGATIDDTEKISFSIEQNQLTFQIGRRIILRLNENNEFGFIMPHDSENIIYLKKSTYSGGRNNSIRNMQYFEGATQNDIEEYLTEIIKCCEIEYLQKGDRSWQHNDNLSFRKSIFNKDFREKIFSQIRTIWWVSQGKSFGKNHKNRGQKYLFAPSQNKNGGSPYPYWESVSKIKKGDIIINYAGTKVEKKYKGIAGISIAKNNAKVGKNKSPDKNSPWNINGWIVDIDCHLLDPNLPYQNLKTYIPQLYKILDASISEQPKHYYNPFQKARPVPNEGYLYQFNYQAIKKIRTLYNKPFPEKIEKILFGNSGFKQKQNNSNMPKDSTQPISKNKKEAQNVIYFGPPGTGKTYKLQELQEKYPPIQLELSRQQLLEQLINEHESTWVEVLAVILKLEVG